MCFQRVWTLQEVLQAWTPAQIEVLRRVQCLKFSLVSLVFISDRLKGWLWKVTRVVFWRWCCHVWAWVNWVCRSSPSSHPFLLKTGFLRCKWTSSHPAKAEKEQTSLNPKRVWSPAQTHSQAQIWHRVWCQHTRFIKNRHKVLNLHSKDLPWNTCDACHC